MSYLKLLQLSLMINVFLLFAFSAIGQKEELLSLQYGHHNYSQNLIEQKKTELSSLPSFQVFSIASTKIETVDAKNIDGGEVLDLNQTVTKKLWNQKEELVKLSIPLSNKPALKLLLKKADFFSSSIMIDNTSGMSKNITESEAYYWGVVEGEETSFVALNIYENEITGIINTNGETFTLGKLKNSQEHILYKEKDLVDQTSFTCSAELNLEKLENQKNESLKSVQAGNVNPNNCVKVHLWANNSLYEEFGNDVTALTNYLTTFFSTVSQIYANEHINMLLNDITIADADGNIVSGPTSLNGSFIMYLDFNPGGGGGGAGGPICGGGGHVYIGSAYEGGAPSYEEGIGTLAHEIGHVLGSPHTDVCFWNGNNTQLDDCGSVPGPWSAGACFDPFNPQFPPGMETLMSYCQHDINLGLGQQPGDLMRWNVYTSTCLSPCDLDCVDGNDNNTCDVDECFPNPIVCRANVALSGWAGSPGDAGGACEASIKAGQSVQFQPDTPTGGSWSWTGPNGFTSNDKLIEVSEGGTYTFIYSDNECTYSKDFVVYEDPCDLTSIICNSNVNNQGFSSDCHVGLASGETVVYSPTNEIAGGTWSWIGPNGFNANQQEITVSEEGEYIVTYSKDGCSVTKAMRVFACTGNLVSSLKIDGVTGWYVSDTVDISEGQTVTFGPHTGGTLSPNLSDFAEYWVWIGPNNFVANNREVTVSDPGIYTVTLHTATCTFSMDITVTLNGCINPIQSFANIANQGWEETSWLTLSSGQTVALSPTPTTGNWTWTGPNGFSSNTREVEVSDLGEYFATYTEGTCSFTQEFLIVECEENPILPSFNVNNQGWINGVNDIFIPSGEAYIKPIINSVTIPYQWGDSPFNWSWTGPNGFSSIGYAISVPYDLPGTYTAIMELGPCIWTQNFNVTNCPASEGTSCDDGDPCTINDVYNSNCECVGSSADSDQDGLCDGLDCQPNNVFFPATPGEPCDDLNPDTINDIITPDGCECKGTNTCVNGGPTNICQYSTNGINYINGCEIQVCEGESLIYTFSGCDANLTLNVTGPNGFNQTATDACGSIFISNSVTPNMSGTYTATLTDNTTSCSTVVTANITVNGNGDAICNDGAQLKAKVFIQGAMIGTLDNLMRDDLRQAGWLPLNEPYSLLNNFQHIGGEVINSQTLNDYGANSVVDWLLIELRDQNEPSNILASQAVLLLKNGNIINSEGGDFITFEEFEKDYYYVAVRHRNHLGVMTANPVALDGTTLVDFTDPNTLTYGTNAQVEMNGVNALWAGNTSINNTLIYSGSNNDVNTTFFDVLLSPSNTNQITNFIESGYYLGDMDLNGQCIFQGNNNEPNILFFNILSHPTSSGINYIIEEQLP